MSFLFQERKNNYWLFSIVLLFCFLISVGVRFQQFKTWEKTPHLYFVGERPLMSTLDAPYWLRWAREYNEGTFSKKDILRDYPKGLKDNFGKKKYLQKDHKQKNNPNDSEIRKIKFRDVPLLSFLIAKITPFLNYNYYLTGTLIIPTLASLFILPLGIYFFKIGSPLSGLVGGLIGTFAFSYFQRSSIGRIDTDMLNLFFPLLAGLMILLASTAKTKNAILFFSACAGLTLFLFQWWYGKIGFTLIYFTVLIFSLFIQQVRFHIILLSALLFLLCADPGNFRGGVESIKSFLKGYVNFEIVEVEEKTQGVKEAHPAIFPKTMTTISEVDKVQAEEVFRRIISNTFLCWIGIIGLFGLVILRWKVMIPLVPMLALGLFSFQSSNRFIMYLAPFIGIGLGWSLNLIIEWLFYFWSRKYKKKKGEETSNNAKIKSDNYIETLAKNDDDNSDTKTENLNIKEISNQNIINSIWNSITFLFRKNIKIKELKEKLKLRGFSIDMNIDIWNLVRQITLYIGMGTFFWGIASTTAISFVPFPSIDPRIYSTFLEIQKGVPKNSVLLTWWDYGYAIVDATGLATFHDGGSQHSPKTYFIARSLLSPDQNELYDITQYLATEGNQGISKNNSSPKVLLKAVRNPTKKPDNPIYLFFTEDMIGKFGAISKLGSWNIENAGSKPVFYQKLACNKISSVELYCRGAKVDLKTGIINNQVPLKRLVFIKDGKVLKKQLFGHKQGFTIQIIIFGTHITQIQLIEESVYKSNFNQMFLLGKYNENFFEETYNAFPFSRLFRFKF